MIDRTFPSAYSRQRTTRTAPTRAGAVKLTMRACPASLARTADFAIVARGVRVKDARMTDTDPDHVKLTERERMLRGLLYDPLDAVLVADACAPAG